MYITWPLWEGLYCILYCIGIRIGKHRRIQRTRCGKTAETLRTRCGRTAEVLRTRCGRDVGVHSWATIRPWVGPQRVRGKSVAGPWRQEWVRDWYVAVRGGSLTGFFFVCGFSLSCRSPSTTFVYLKAKAKVFIFTCEATGGIWTWDFWYTPCYRAKHKQKLVVNFA